jgi:hypothetical protein
MLSQIDYYQPTEMSLQEADECQADALEAEYTKGQREAINAPYISRFAGHSPEWWAGFLTELADRNGVSFACFPQPQLSKPEEF